MSEGAAVRAGVVLLAVLSAPHAMAESTEALFFDPMPVVLSVSRLPQPLPEVPGAATMIDRSFIEATGYRDLARVLRLVPGMMIGQERGHYQWVTYHGLGNDFPTEMQVMIDGRSVYSPSSFGGVDWYALPLAMDEIDRIEVVRGTNTNAYGANAFLGAINILTRHASELPERRVHVRMGGDGIRDLSASVSNAANGAAFRLSAVSRRDGGFEELEDNSQLDVLTLRGDVQIDTDNALVLRVGISSALRGEGYAASSLNNNGLRNSRSFADTLHLQWRRTTGADEEWMLNLYRNHERIRDRWAASTAAESPPLPYYDGVPLDRDRDSVRHGVELQRRQLLAPGIKAVWGLEWRRDEVDAPFLFSQGRPDHLDLQRLFANLEWRLRQDLNLNAGVLHEKYQGEAAHFTPRAFLNWQATANDTLRAGYARAYKQLTLFEKYGDIRAVDPVSGDVLVRPYLPNPGLRQSRVDSVEVGYFGRLPQWRASLDVRVFNERIRDFILRVPQPDPFPAPVLSPVLGSARYENYGHAFDLRGLEYQLEAEPQVGSRFRLTHTLVDPRAGDPDVDRRVSPYAASMSWLQDWRGGWHSMVSMLRMGALAGGDGFVPRFRYSAEPYTSWDLNLWRTVRVRDTAVRYSLSAINVGARHQEIADRSMQFLNPGRPINPVSAMVWLGLALSF